MDNAANDATYDVIKKRDQEFTDWRKKAAEGIPEIAARVFALRHTGYMGCGFHWSLEKRLGAVINRLNDYDDHTLYNTPGASVHQIIVRVLTEALYKDVEKAESSKITARKIKLPNGPETDADGSWTPSND